MDGSQSNVLLSIDAMLGSCLVDINGLSTLGDKLETGGRRISESCDVPGEVSAGEM